MKFNIKEFFERIKNLRDEDAKKSAKLKSFNDFLRFLKDMGIRETSYKQENEQEI